MRIQSRQDPLNFPIMLNNKLAALGDVVEDGEAAPTAQDYTVFADLSQRLDRELAALDRGAREPISRRSIAAGAGASCPPWSGARNPQWSRGRRRCRPAKRTTAISCGRG